MNGVFSFTWTGGPGPNTGFNLGCQENPDVSETRVIINPTTGPGDLGAYTFTEDEPSLPWAFDSVSCVGDSESSVSGRTASVDLDLGENVTCTFNNIAVPEQRFTGGGSFYPNTTDTNPQHPSFYRIRITHGFTLHCNEEVLPNRLEVNWAGNGKGRNSENNFHLTSLTAAQCIDDGQITEEHPLAGVDTYEGWGEGTFNNLPGYRAHWVVTDAGEPGGNDEVWMVIVKVSNGSEVLRVGGAWDAPPSNVYPSLMDVLVLDSLVVCYDASVPCLNTRGPRTGVDGANIDVGNQQAHQGS
jgi:hypothetical protein